MFFIQTKQQEIGKSKELFDQISLDLEGWAEDTRNKTKVLTLTDHRILPVCIYGQNIEGVVQFVYPRNVSIDHNTEFDAA